MKKLLMTTALVMLAAGPIAAQDTTAATGTDMAAPMYTAGDMQISADKLVGHTVYTKKADAPADTESLDVAAGVEDAPDSWESVGEVGDVLISKDGMVDSIVIDAGGFLGMGERNVQLAMDQLQFVRDSNDEGEYFVVYTGDRAMLEGASEYDEAALHDQGYTSSRDLKTGTADTAMATDAAAAPDQVAVDARANRDAMQKVDFTTLTAEDLQGARVYGTGDDWVGDIGHLVLGEDGKITQAVIDVGGWLGMGEHPVAMSFDQIDLRRDGDDGAITAYVDATKDELEALPKWEG